MKGKHIAFTFLFAIATPGIVFNFNDKVNASQVCQTTDPTGTPLNVRNSPNGKVINSLKNGRNVDILEISDDDRGRPWAKVGGYHNGNYRVWGWVIREFVSCYNT